MQIFTFLTIVICTGLLYLLTFLTTKNVWWSGNCYIGLLFYVWILVRHTILSREALLKKYCFNLLGIFGIVLANQYD